MAIIQYISENVGWDLNVNLDGLLCLPFLHVGFNVTDNLLQLGWQQFTVVSSFVRQAVGSLLTVFGSAAMKLVESAPETSIGGSLKLLSLRSAFLLFLALCRCRITSNLLIYKLYTKDYLSSLAKQVT